MGQDPGAGKATTGLEVVTGLQVTTGLKVATGLRFMNIPSHNWH